ncbi:uncharacterized protein E0L32_004551 [Thyridium curvatum]|uniref:Nitrate reductase [NADPH] n=1 Tax=Thyridium curvatum TaxID=1093900 RepID=A0A507B9I7_9PEZI|nr:uncharacterized protein E0L32_004551 [Thyridium curvatum]TPX15274.1 hypothetical protein E0L32_004551 [Thyridium curvatum]
MAAQAPRSLLSQVLRIAARPQPAVRIRPSWQPCSRRCIHATPRRLTARPDHAGGKRANRNNGSFTLLAASGGLLASLFAILPPDSKPTKKKSEAAAAPPEESAQVSSVIDNRDPSLPRFRLADVKKHDASSPEPWVTSGDKVYNITEWIPAHPGGEVILRAAGSSIDPYWDIFTIHKTQYVRDILETYLVGFIDVADLDEHGQPRRESIEDPFAQDPARDPRLLTLTQKPRNAEPPGQELARDFLTPNELFYVRNHMWVPVVDEEEKAGTSAFALTIELPDGETKKYSMRDLRERFPHHRVTAVMQCSGNRRSDMTRAVGATNGLQWGAGAISNAEWEGVRLSDVLADAGFKTADQYAAASTAVTPIDSTSQTSNDDQVPDPKNMHVHLAGMEAYSASIPLSTAIDPRGDVLLAWGMNGKVLPRDHGYPLRAVVPGHVAARSVKWLNRIAVADEESSSQWQKRDYKCFGPNEGAKPNWDKYPAMQELPVTSAVTSVRVGRDAEKEASTTTLELEKLNGERAPPGVKCPRAWAKEHVQPEELAHAPPVSLAGYAYSGGGHRVVRVDVSTDGGRTWDQARLLDSGEGEGEGDGQGQKIYGNKAWSWRRWQYAGRLPASKEGECAEVVVKATDDAYNGQPETQASVYNARGNLATAWHRVKVCPRCVGREEWVTGDVFGSGFKKEEPRKDEGKK